MGDTDLHPDPKYDLVVWGCYMTGHLQREHRELSDITNSNRALEDAFMGWHDTAPKTFWMYSFRVKHQLVIRMCDPSLRQHLFPFTDPSCLVNSQYLTDKQVVDMHHADSQTLEFTDEEEQALVQCRTRP
eukprot:3696943-Rhodomonas_salina.1